MANAADLLLKIGADASKLHSELNGAFNKTNSFAQKATKSFKAVALSLVALGTTAAGALGTVVYMLNNTLGEIDALVTEADRLGILTSELQRLMYIAGQTDVETTELTNGIKFMLKNMDEASQGVGEAKDAFEALGINLDKLKKLGVSDQFNAISQALGNISNRAERVNILMAIFGRAGLALGPLLAANMEKIGLEFDRLGLKLTESQVQMSDDFDNAKKKLGAIWDGFKMQVATEVSPVFLEIIKLVENTVTESGGMREVARNAAIGLSEMGITGIKAMEGIHKGLKANKILIDSIIGSFQTLKAGTSRVLNSVGEQGQTGNYITRPGRGFGEFIYNLMNPSAEQLDREAEMMPAVGRVHDGFRTLNDPVPGTGPIIDFLQENIDRLNSLNTSESKSGRLSADDTSRRIFRGTDARGNPSFSDKQEVNVTTEIKFNDRGLFEVVDQRVEKQMNDSARGVAR